MISLISLFLAAQVFACGPDYCGREPICGQYIGNRTPVDQEYYVNGCTGPLPILDANNFTGQNITLFLDEAFHFSASEAFEKSRSRAYPDTEFYAKKPEAVEFFTSLVNSEKLSKESTKALLDLRAGLTEDATNKKSMADFSKRTEALPAEAKKSQSFAYLQAAAAFYLGDLAGARMSFASLSASHLPDLAEASKYLEARAVFNEAQIGWDGYQHDDGKLPDQGKLAESEQLFKAYLEKFPTGKFAASARGLIRKVHYLRHNLAAYNQMLSDAISAIDTSKPENADALYSLLDEYDTHVESKETTTENLHPYLWVIRSYYFQRNAPEEEWSAEQKAGELARLAKAEKSFAQYPDLYQFVKANLLYGSGKYAEAKNALAKIPPETFLLRRSLLVLRANILVKQKNYSEAEALVAKYIDSHPQEVTAKSATEADEGNSEEEAGHHILSGYYTFLFFWHKKPEAAFLPKNLKRINPGSLEMLTRKTLPTAKIKEIFTGLKDNEWRDTLGSVLVNRQILQKSFREALDTLKAQPTIFPAEVAKQLTARLTTLSQTPDDPDALLRLADFYISHEGQPPKGYQSNRFIALCGGGKQEKLIWPIHLLKTAIEKSPVDKKTDTEKNALATAITCFRTKAISECYNTSDDSGIPVSIRKKWFQTLKKKYGDSKEAEEISYYW